VLVRIADDDWPRSFARDRRRSLRPHPAGIQGYYQNPKITEEFLQDGWCHTGDIGFLDRDGSLHISDRKKNMVKSGGISVFPEEIEETLRKHPDVTDAAVIGFKSGEWGEAVNVFVVLNPGAVCHADALIQFCKESLAAYKAPKVWSFFPPFRAPALATSIEGSSKSQIGRRDLRPCGGGRAS
jgi:acyl-CoA synthetase (AMP-forming)/AMP-acid ligase II